MNFDKQFKELSNLSAKIKSDEFPAITETEKQAAIALADLESAICELIMADATLQIMCFSLFYFWIQLEGPLRGLNEKQIKDMSIHIDQTILKAMIVVKRKLHSLPKQEYNSDLSVLGKKLNELKSYLSDDMFNPPMPYDEHIKKIEMVNEMIHQKTSDLLRKNVHSEIIANVLFNYFLRLVNLRSSVPEEEHQKIEYYFTEIITAIRREMSSGFRNVK